ncbi:hypothetical protein TVAG_120350 [Trichomonas vaginalis G3]|uniref:Uncharacterized protein n=1 Tax=Trichomonas vaginalis (strain ATCC PRA-98 / G3) TaxID=412133 RepID=A2D7I0_TRIV3|nr:protein ubiquitination [Trichomonas vaginalis G3]EAY23697.1 hypothetical protein TVAG_120350 [Trichomonas vaginalis G3]KAI5490192.1 protein ubiquitination [Trichomonas vaginalis G3]|eukprot:XP_001276945.1 hypothetical protein [Trichomonas vaginalis G3]
MSIGSYQEHANNIDKYLANKTFYNMFKKDDICRILDHMRVTIDQACLLLEQSKGKLTPLELFETLQHWKINFGWNADKAAKISLLLSDLLKAPFFNEYIRYFLKRIVESYEDTAKDAKKKSKTNKKVTQENEQLKRQHQIDAMQMQSYEQIHKTNIENLLNLQAEIVAVKEREQKLSKLVESKDYEIARLRVLIGNSSDENEGIKKILANTSNEIEQSKSFSTHQEIQSPNQTKSSKNAKNSDNLDPSLKAQLTSEISFLNNELVKSLTELTKYKVLFQAQNAELENLKAQLNKVDENQTDDKFNDEEIDVLPTSP